MSTSPERYREKYTEAFAGSGGSRDTAAETVNALGDSHYGCGPEALRLQDQLPLENLTRGELRRFLREVGVVRGRDEVTAARLRTWIAGKDSRVAQLEQELEAQRQLVEAGKSGRSSLANLKSIAASRARRLTGAASGLAGRSRMTLRRSGRKSEDE